MSRVCAITQVFICRLSRQQKGSVVCSMKPCQQPGTRLEPSRNKSTWQHCIKRADLKTRPVANGGAKNRNEAVLSFETPFDEANEIKRQQRHCWRARELPCSRQTAARANDCARHIESDPISRNANESLGFSFDALLASSESRARALDIHIRVGHEMIGGCSRVT